jgi:hypothetical protein
LRPLQPKVIGNFIFEQDISNVNSIYVKAEISIEGVGPLPTMRFTATSMQHGFQTLETEIKKWNSNCR